MTAKSCLIFHPDTEDPAIKDFYIGVKARFDNGRPVLRYELIGKLNNLLIPAPKPPRATDELWQHTCFEAFIAVEEDEKYYEYNFSPSGEWAAYAFDDYRQRSAWQASQGNTIYTERYADRLVVTAIIDADNLPAKPLGKSYRLSMTAVLETLEGDLSYWALSHPAGKPDFHHRRGFTLSLNY